MATKLEQRSENAPELKDDITIMIGGQGGDGTLTVVNLLGRVFRDLGLNIYDARNVLSRIRGGHADGVIRGSTRDVYCIGDTIDILVAFDEEAVQAGLPELSEKAIIIFDSSKGQLSERFRKPTFSIYSAPLGNMAASELRRNIFKNTIAFAILGRLLGLDDQVLMRMLTARYERRGKEALEANLKALTMGFEFATKNITSNPYTLARGDYSSRILSTGNEAAAYGFLVSGGRFFIGYPITPATDIMEWLAPRLPKFGGIVKQAEDELAVINMGIGAAYAGARVMVATSGPGQSLMTEGVGHAGEAEVPIVVAQCQRVGPSTGEPTKNEQSDINHVVYSSHGEFPRLVVAPGTAGECFEMTSLAMNLAEKYQLPVYLLLDQALCQNSASIDPFDLNKIHIDRGKLVTEEDLAKMPVYKRYEFTEDGISFRSIPSQEGGESQVTGNEHNEFGSVSTDKTNRLRMMRKRMMKLELAKKDLPRGNNIGPKDAKIGIIGFGSTYGPIIEAMQQLRENRIVARFHQIKTIWPLLEDNVQEFVDQMDYVFVVENNYQGQLAAIIKSQISKPEIVQSITKFDGSSFKPKEISGSIYASIRSRVVA
ncbi:MAG: 2-oxoacid:acceptor oxidoreductase subunit alpha [Thaumarchaeota archaeon]|nr:2-oxoacid:acceptor oxidoreductase subunit alpha [Nitrososphaerota archaeon]